MLKQVIQHCSTLTTGNLIFWGIVLAIGLELITVWARFALGLESTRDTQLLSMFTFGVRIHHGYIGLLLLALCLFIDGGNRNLIMMIGFALFFSDLIHHFLVLWPITGSHQFDLFYHK